MILLYKLLIAGTISLVSAGTAWWATHRNPQPQEKPLVIEAKK